MTRHDTAAMNARLLLRNITDRHPTHTVHGYGKSPDFHYCAGRDCGHTRCPVQTLADTLKTLIHLYPETAPVVLAALAGDHEHTDEPVRSQR